MSRFWILICCVFSAGPAAAVSQAGGIIEVFLPSARDEGLAGSFVFGDAGPFAMHGNPAALANGLEGAQAGYSHSKLVPDFADDIFVEHYGIRFGSELFSLGFLYSNLEQGEQRSYDVGGNLIETFEAWQRNLQIGVAADVMGLIQDPEDAQFQLRTGLSFKALTDHLGADTVTQPQVTDEATAYTLDLGLQGGMLLRESSGGAMPAVGVRVGAVLDDLFQAELDYDDPGQSDPIHRDVHFGGALDFDFFEQSELGPAIGFTMQYEQTRSRLESDDTVIHRFAGELRFAQIVALRIGHVIDDEGQIKSPSIGAGLDFGWLDLPLDLRVDYAGRPQAEQLSRVDVVSVQAGWRFDMPHRLQRGRR